MAHDPSTLAALKIDRPAAAPRRSSLPLVLGVVVVVVAALALWYWLRRPAAAVVEVAQAREIAAGGDRTLLNASGYVTARRNATVSSKVTGRVVEVLIEEGMKVEKDQLLARLDPTNVETNLRLAEAQAEAARRGLGETEATLEQAERTLRRTEALTAARATSAQELDRAAAEVAALRARLERQRAEILVAERQFDLWRQQMEDTLIRAPFAGVVTSKNAQPGEMISPNSAGGGFTRTGICTIVDMASLEVEVDVNESYINRVQAGQPVVVTLDSYPDWRIPSRVIAIIPTADRQKATVRVRVGFDELDPRILPDMGLKVAFQSAETGPARPAARLVVIPQRAVRRAGDDDLVWVVREGRVERRAITVESTRDDEANVLAGLAAGEVVVVGGGTGLTDGARVVVKSP